jgi:pyruvate/2-oxoglutarate dehydrogenase complex dihydrolipoamide dehydrogenase (E3) component
VHALEPDVVVVATGGLPNKVLLEERDEQDLAVTAWDIIAGDAKPGSDVLIYDESGDHPGLMAAEVVAQAGARVEVMSPDRSVAPEIMGMNLAPYLEVLQRHGVQMTVARRLLEVERAGNQLKARIGTDYSDLVEEKLYDQVVVNYGTLPMDELYFALKPASRNLGEVDYDALIEGRVQALERNPEGRFALYRIGDAVSARNTHAAIYDALRLMKDI